MRTIRARLAKAEKVLAGLGRSDGLVISIWLVGNTRQEFVASSAYLAGKPDSLIFRVDGEKAEDFEERALNALAINIMPDAVMVACFKQSLIL